MNQADAIDGRTIKTVSSVECLDRIPNSLSDSKLVK